MKSNTKSYTRIALCAALLCILAPLSIPIPISSVSLTLSTFVLALIAYVLPPKQALCSVGLYLLLGAIGLPVFSGFGGGIARFFGAGGGYLIGYLPMVYLSATFLTKHPSNRFLQALGLLLGTLVLSTLGTAWMAFVTGATFLQTLPAGLFAFLPLDLLKLCAALLLGPRLQKSLHTLAA